MVRHATSYRPDIWVLMLSLSAAYLRLRWPDGLASLIAAGVIAVVAYHVKAPGLAIGLAVLLAELLRQRWWHAVGFAAGLAGLFVAVNVTLGVALGTAYQENLSGGLAVPFSVMFPLQLVIDMAPAWVMLVFPLAWLLVDGLSARNGGHGAERRTLVAFWAVAIVVAAATSMRLGSNVYYFLEATVYGTLLLAWWLDAAWQRLPKDAGHAPPDDRGSAMLVCLIILVLIVSRIDVTRANFAMMHLMSYDRVEKAQQQVESAEQLAAMFNRMDGPVWTDNINIAIRLDEPAVLYPYVDEARAAVDRDLRLERLRQVGAYRFAAILLPYQQFEHQGVTSPSDAFVLRVREHYRQTEQYGGYRLFVPPPGVRPGP